MNMSKEEIEELAEAAPMADVELLPLPEWTKRDDLGGLVPSEVRVEMRKYARANMEPLRAEVERLKRHAERQHAAYWRANRRAERLAEVLRRHGQHDDTCGVLVFGQIRCTCGFSAALQDQEDGNG